MSAQPQKVAKLRDFPVAEDDDIVKRPYRLWHTGDRAQVQYAYFKNLRHAHMRALSEAAWAKGDAVIEVFDLRVGALRGQYHRHGDQIRFWRSHHTLEDQ